MINETRQNKHRESCKTHEHDVFETKKRKCNNDKYSKLCGTLEHEELKQKKKRKQHKTFLDNIRGSPQHEKTKNQEEKWLKNSVQAFKTQEGPFYVCIVCNRYVYGRSVSWFRFENCDNLNESILFVFTLMMVNYIFV